MIKKYINSWNFIVVLGILLQQPVLASEYSYLKEQLLNEMNKYFLQNDFFATNFSSLDLLKIDRKAADKAVEVDGSYTRYAFGKLFEKALSGCNVTVVILGGSSSQGADLGFMNTRSTFHYGLKVWWDSVVAPITGSYMFRRVVAIGGVGTTYMSLCWKEYIRGLTYIDLILWEFFINDPDSKDYAGASERLINSVLSHPDRPALLFVKFFRHQILKLDSMGFIVNASSYCSTEKIKTDVLKTACSKHQVTMVNLLSVICGYLKQGNPLNVREILISHHPSHLAHAQVTYVLVQYIQKQLKHFLLQSSADPYKELRFPEKSKAVCWSAVSPSYTYHLQSSIFDLNVVENFGFRTIKSQRWNFSIAYRLDVRGGYMGSGIGSRIVLSSTLTKFAAIYFAISHQEDGGAVSLSVYSVTSQNSISIDCSRRQNSAMSVQKVIDAVIGFVEFHMDILTNGVCFLNAIIIDYM